MSLKILGGVAKGFSLPSPPSQLVKELRPTSVLLRRKLFDAHQEMEGTLFVDLFAGSGAVGIEALSRGASFAFFIERHRKTIDVLKENLEELIGHYPFNFSPCRAICQDASKWPKNGVEELWQKWLEGEVEEVIFFLDPPYEKSGLYDKALRNLEETFVNERFELLSHTTVWLEGDQKKGRSREAWEQHLSEHFPRWHLVKSYTQGSHYVLILRFRENS